MAKLRHYTWWLGVSVFLQLFTGLLHSLSFFNNPKPGNETEEQLLMLMQSYQMNMGSGFSPTMLDLMNSMSIAFVLLLLSGGVVIWFLLVKKTNPAVMKGISLIYTITYLICFIAMLFLAFLPPVVMTGLIMVSLMIAYLLNRSNKTVS